MRLNLSFRGKIVALLMTMIVLVAVYVLGLVFNGGTAAAKTAETPLLPSFSPSVAAHIVLSPADGRQISIRHKNSGWVVDATQRDLPGLSAKVTTLLASIAGLQQGKLVNSKSALLPSFNLTESSAGRIRVADGAGKKVADILIGKRGASGYEDYLRLDGDSRVWLTRSSLSFYLSQAQSYWYNLSLLPDDATGESIQSIKVAGFVPIGDEQPSFERETYVLNRSRGAPSSQWALKGDNLALNQSKVQSACNRLATLQGVDFFLNPVPASVHSFELTVVTDQNRSYVLHGEPISAGTQYLITRGGEPYVYVVNTAALRRAVQPLGSLLAK